MNLSNVSFIMQLGMSSLHSAVKRDYFEVFAELLDSGADLYVRDEVRKFFLFLKYILHCTKISSQYFSLFELR